MVKKSSIKIAGLATDVFEPTGTARASLLFSHGAWVGGWIWESFAAWFSDKGFTCYCPTWRGHYDSKPVADLGAVSIYDFVEDALDVSRAVKPNFLFGESLGGLIALKASESLPDLKGIVLMNPVPPFMIPASFTVIRKQLKYLGDLIGKKPNLPNESDYKELILNNVEEPEATEFYRKICPDSGRALLEASMGRIKVDPTKVRPPIHLVVGHLDQLLPPKVHRKLAGIFNADVVEYPEKSHHTFSEDGWEEVAEETLGWIEKRLP